MMKWVQEIFSARKSLLLGVKRLLQVAVLTIFWGMICLQLAAQKTSLVQSDLLQGAGTHDYDVRHPADSIIPVLEEQLLDTAIMADQSKFLVFKTALGYAYTSTGQFGRAINTFLDVQKGFESLQDDGATAFVHQWLSYDYKMLEQYEPAERHARKALNYNMKAGFLEGAADAYIALGNALIKQDSLDSAMHYYVLSQEVALEGNYNYGLARSYNNMGNVQMLQHRYDSAISNYQRAISIARIRNSEAPVLYLNNLGGAYLAIGDAEMAFPLLKAAVDSAGPKPDRGFQLNAYRNLAAAGVALGDFETAYHAKDTLIRINAEILKARFNAQFAEQEAQSNTEIQALQSHVSQVEHELKEVKQNRDVDQRNVSIAAVITILIIIALAWLAFIFKRQSNKLITEQKSRVDLMNALLEDKVRQRTEDLSQVNTELDHLLYRSSHDLRTPIVLLKQLLEKLEHAKTSQEAAEIYAEVDLDVASLDHLNLSMCEAGDIRLHTPTLSRVEIKPFVQEIANNMPGNGILLEYQPPQGIAVMADPWLLRLAIQQVFQNAIDASKSDGLTVKIQCNSIAEGVEVRIADNGPGVPEELQDNLFDLFIKGNTVPNRHGLGLYKARLALIKMGGSIQLEANGPNGARFRLQLPAPTFS